MNRNSSITSLRKAFENFATHLQHPLAQGVADSTCRHASMIHCLWAGATTILLQSSNRIPFVKIVILFWWSWFVALISWSIYFNSAAHQSPWASMLTQWCLSEWRKRSLLARSFMRSASTMSLTLRRKGKSVWPRRRALIICTSTCTRVLALVCPSWRMSRAHGIISWHPHLLRANSHGEVLAYMVGARRILSMWRLILF